MCLTPTAPPQGAQLCQLLVDAGAAKVDPADESEDPRVLVGQLPEEVVLSRVLLDLDGDAAVDPLSIEVRPEFGWKVVAPEGGHRFVDPGVDLRVVLPEMLMGIDLQGSSRSSKGAPSTS